MKEQPVSKQKLVRLEYILCTFSLEACKSAILV